MRRGRQDSTAWPGRPNPDPTHRAGSSVTRQSSGTASPRCPPTPTNAPVIVERAEGRELIDVDGRRYFDAISSLWVTTLGHRVPELDAARHRPARPGGPRHPARERNRAAVELAEALAARRARRRSPRPVRLRRRGRRRAGAQDRLPVLDQPRGSTGRDRFLALGDAYHGDTVGALSLGRRWLRHRPVRPLRFPVVRTPGYDDPDWATRLVGPLEAHAAALAAVVIEPLVQGAAGMLVAEPRGPRAGSARPAGRRRPADLRRGGDRFRPDRQALRVRAGWTFDPTCSASARGSPAAISRCRRPSPPAGSSRRSSVPISGERPSTTATPTAGTRWPARWPSGTSSSSTSGSARQRRHRRAQLAERLATRSRRLTGVREIRQRGLMVGVELAPPRGRAAVGSTGLRRCGRAGRAAAATRRRGGGDASAHHRPATRSIGWSTYWPRRSRRCRPRTPVEPHRRGGVSLGRVGRRRLPVGRGRGAVARTAHLRRTRARRRPRGPAERPGASGPLGVTDGSPVVSFASNDYLGLQRATPRWWPRRKAALDRWGAGSGASRLVTGSRPVHDELESALAAWKGCERAVLFPTGFTANLSVLSAFGA